MTDTEPSSHYVSAPGVPPVRIQGYPKRRSSRSIERARARAEGRSAREKLLLAPPGAPTPEDDPAYADFLIDTDHETGWSPGTDTAQEIV
jgi:hypothetical protein